MEHSGTAQGGVEYLDDALLDWIGQSEGVEFLSPGVDLLSEVDLGGADIGAGHAEAACGDVAAVL